MLTGHPHPKRMQQAVLKSPSLSSPYLGQLRIFERAVQPQPRQRAPSIVTLPYLVEPTVTRDQPILEHIDVLTTARIERWRVQVYQATLNGLALPGN